MSSEGLSGSEDYRTSIGGDMCHNTAGPSRALQAGQSSKIVKSKSASEIIRLCF